MTIKQLSGYVGSNVEITFHDGKTKKEFWVIQKNLAPSTATGK